MQKDSSDDFVDALNTTGFSSFCFACPEDKIIIPEELVEQDVSKQQQDKSTVELSEESNSADVSKPHDKTAVQSNKDGMVTEESNNEEKRADDPNQEDKPTNVPSNARVALGVQGLINRLETNKGTLSALGPADGSNKRDKPEIDSNQQEDKPINGKEKNSSEHLVNSSEQLVNALNTTDFSSSFFAYLEDQNIIELAEQDASKQQGKSAIEFSEEAKSTDVSKEQDKTTVHSNKEGKRAEASINEEKRADDLKQEDKHAEDSSKVDKPEFAFNQEEKASVPSKMEDELVADLKIPDALDQLVAATAATEKALVAAATEIAAVLPFPSDSKRPKKPKQTLVESPNFKIHAKIRNVPALTPVSDTGTNSDGGSDEEVIVGGDSPSDSFSSQSCINESDEEGESHSHYHEGVHDRSHVFSTDAVNEDDLVDEAYNSMNVSVLSLAEIFQDDLATDISALTPGLGTVIAEAAIEELGPIYSLGISFESTVSKASTQHNRSIMGDWAAEVMSIEVSLEAGKYTLQNMDDPGEDTCVAQERYFMSRTEYLPRLTAHDKHAIVERPQDEIEADTEAANYYVKAQWNEFLPATIFSSNWNDFCSG